MSGVSESDVKEQVVDDEGVETEETEETDEISTSSESPTRGVDLVFFDEVT